MKKRTKFSQEKSNHLSLCESAGSKFAERAARKRNGRFLSRSPGCYRVRLLTQAGEMTAGMCAILLVAIATSNSTAQELPLPVTTVDRTDPVDFASEIMPMLKRNCLACHHQKEAEGGLVLESVATTHKGGDNGAGVVAKDVSASLIFTRATGAEEPLMPPEDNSVGAKPLTADELGLLKLWIEQGATGTDSPTTEPLQFQPIPESIRTVYALDTSPDGQYVAVGRGNRVAIFDTAGYVETARLADKSLSMGDVADVDLIQSLAFSPDGRRIATGGFRTVRIWKKERSPFDATASPLATASGRVAIKPDGSVAAIVNAIGDIELWDLRDNTKRHSLSGHADRITGIAWAKSNDKLFSCDQSGRLVLWNAAGGEKAASIETQSSVSGLVASSDGSHVAAIDEQRKVRMFQINDQNAIATIPGPASEVTDATAIVFCDQPSPCLVVASESAAVTIRNLVDGKTIRTIDHSAVVYAVAVTADHTKLITGGHDGATKIWNIADGAALATMQGDPQLALQVTLADRNANRQKAELERMNQLTKSLEERLKKENEALAKVNEAQKKSIETLAAQEKSRTDAVALVSATEAKIAKADVDAKAANDAIAAAQKALADAVAMKEAATKELEANKKAVVAAEATKKKTETVIANRKQTIASAEAARKLATDAIPAHQLVVSRESGRLKQLESRKTDQQKRLAEPSEQVVAISVNADGSQIATAHHGGDVRIYRAADGLPLDQFTSTPPPDRPSVAFAGDLVVGFSDNQPAKLWSQAIQWTLERTIGSVDDPSILTDRVTAIDFRPDGMSVAVGSGPPSRSGDVKVFAVNTGQLVRDFGTIHSDTVLSLDFSPNGLLLASAAADKTIRLLDVATGKEVRSMEGHTHHVLGVGWQDDGRTIASAGADRTIKVWNTETGQQNRTIAGFAKEITAVAFVATTNQVASVCANGQARISNTADGKAIRNFDAAGDFLNCVAVSPDGKNIIVGGHSGTVRIWAVADGKLVAELK